MGRLLLKECLIEGDVVGRVIKPSSTKRTRRSVTVNQVESPLGWLFTRGHISRRQYDAGEKLRGDWERGQLASRVTMAWDASPISSGRGGTGGAPDLHARQIDARKRFEAASQAAGPGCRTSFGVLSAEGRACAMPRRLSAGRPARVRSC